MNVLYISLNVYKKKKKKTFEHPSWMFWSTDLVLVVKKEKVEVKQKKRQEVYYFKKLEIDIF